MEDVPRRRRRVCRGASRPRRPPGYHNATRSHGGVDLELTKDGRRYLVQCKHWRVQSVGVTVIRELNGVVAARGASGGFVVTSGTFTPEARAFAVSCPIELIDGEQLEDMIRQPEVDSLSAASGGGSTSFERAAMLQVWIRNGPARGEEGFARGYRVLGMQPTPGVPRDERDLDFPQAHARRRSTTSF